MQTTHPRYSKEEFARRGDEIYEREIHPQLGGGQEGYFVAIDIEAGAYEIEAVPAPVVGRAHAGRVVCGL